MFNTPWGNEQVASTKKRKKKTASKQKNEKPTFPQESEPKLYTITKPQRAVIATNQKTQQNFFKKTGANKK